MSKNSDTHGSHLKVKFALDKDEEDITDKQPVGSPTAKVKKVVRTFFVGLVVIFALAALSAPQEARAQGDVLTIPAESDWVDQGIIFTAGLEGEWDNILWGGFAGCVTKMNGLFYLYYQGSDGYDVNQGTVTNRAIGLATSGDGINFEKDISNPVVTYSPNNMIEEGAVSCGLSMEGSQLVMYYGANKALHPSRPYINANGIAATSTDGRNFSDAGIALSYQDSSLWGSGDEVFPVMSLKAPETNEWIVYYIPNGVPETHTLGVAWGNSMLNLSNSAGVTDSGGNVATWGMGGGVVSLQDGTYAVFSNDVATRQMEARIMDPNSPSQFSDPVQTYNFADFSSGVVYFDAVSNTWFLFYRNYDASAYGVKTAAGPSGGGDPVNQPPTVSAGADQTVDLQNGSASVALDGTAGDDGLPNQPGALTVSWSVVSGPGSVSFGDAGSLDTMATMTAEGDYLLELAVSDGEYTVTDNVTITVEVNQPPPPGPTCEVDTAEWSRSSTKDGRNVQLKANTSNCTSGQVIHFDIYEVLDGGQSPMLFGSFTAATAGNGLAKVNWTAVYNCDEPGIDCPAPGNDAMYYFEAYVDGVPDQITTSPQLTVSP